MQLERICRGYRRAVVALEEGTPGDSRLERFVRVRETEAGMVRLEVQLAPDEAAMVLRAIDAARQGAAGVERHVEPVTGLGLLSGSPTPLPEHGDDNDVGESAPARASFIGLRER